MSRNLAKGDASLTSQCLVLLDQLFVVKMELESKKEEGLKEKLAKVVERMPRVPRMTELCGHFITFRELREQGPDSIIDAKNQAYEEINACVALHQLTLEMALKLNHLEFVEPLLKSARACFVAYSTPEAMFNYHFYAGTILQRV